MQINFVGKRKNTKGTRDPGHDKIKASKILVHSCTTFLCCLGDEIYDPYRNQNMNKGRCKKKKRIYLGLCPKTSDPTHPLRTFWTPLSEK